jgi:hypothetical protein
VEELFQLEKGDNDLCRLIRKPTCNSKLRLLQINIGIQAYVGRRSASHAFQQALSPPPCIVSGDSLAHRLLSVVLHPHPKKPITLESASNKQIRAYLTAKLSTAPDQATSVIPETGTKKDWNLFWRAKIPHRARTIWWRFKRDWLPCGTVRHRIWNQDPHCEMSGCREKVANKNHFIFQCPPKYNAWQTILKEYTTKDLWTDADLHSSLSFLHSTFSIKPQFDISVPQLLACCLLGVSTANTVLFLHRYTQSTDDIIHTIKKEINKTIAQNSFLSS